MRTSPGVVALARAVARPRTGWYAHAADERFGSCHAGPGGSRPPVRARRDAGAAAGRLRARLARRGGGGGRRASWAQLAAERGRVLRLRRRPRLRDPRRGRTWVGRVDAPDRRPERGELRSQ